MIRDVLLAEIAASEAKISATEESNVFSASHKETTIATEKAAIAQKRDEISGFDNLVDQSKG